MNDLYNVSEVKLTYESNNTNKKKLKVNSSMKIYELMLNNWEQIEYRETFKVLYLDLSNNALGINTVSMGGLSEVDVDVRMIMQGALLTKASAIACCHNHLSGDVNPSFGDDVITLRIMQAAKVLDIKLLDHVIITEGRYYSYRDNKRLK